MNACHATPQWKDEVMSAYRELDPSLAVVYVPYQADELPEPEPMQEVIWNLEKVLIIDTHTTILDGEKEHLTLSDAAEMFHSIRMKNP
jgi:hypothetical protein